MWIEVSVTIVLGSFTNLVFGERLSLLDQYFRNEIHIHSRYVVFSSSVTCMRCKDNAWTISINTVTESTICVVPIHNVHVGGDDATVSVASVSHKYCDNSLSISDAVIHVYVSVVTGS